MIKTIASNSDQTIRSDLSRFSPAGTRFVGSGTLELNQKAGMPRYRGRNYTTSRNIEPGKPLQTRYISEAVHHTRYMSVVPEDKNPCNIVTWARDHFIIFSTTTAV